MFSLNGQDEVTEWIEAAPTATKKPKPVDIEKREKEPKQKRMMQRLSRYLKPRYAFRYNLLTERTEYARLNTEATNSVHHLAYKPVDNRTLNGIALAQRHRKWGKLLGS